MSTKDDFENVVRNDLKVRAADGTYDRMHRLVLAAHGPAEGTRAPIFPRRVVMEKPVVKLVIAAAVIAAVTLGLLEFLNPAGSSGVVWADVARRVEASRGFTSRMRQTQTVEGVAHPIEMHMTTYSSSQGSRMENHIGGKLSVATYADYETGEIVSLLHELKQYTRQTIPPSPAGGGGGNMDPRMIVKDFLAGDYKELGRRTVEGVEAEGIEVTRIPNSMANFAIDSEVAQLWVSVETGYPVMFESTVIGNGGKVKIETVIDQFEWNVELDPSQFKAEVPADYTLLETPQQ